MSKNISVFGILKTRKSVESAIEELRLNDFRQADISVLVPENVGNKDMLTAKSSKAPEGAATGGAGGAVTGGVLGWLIGAGMLAVPGLGLVAAAGPIMAALAGVGVGATVGGVTGALVGFGIPEYEAKRFEGRVRDGGILMSVHCDNEQWADRAENLLRRLGAEDVSRTSEASADFDQTDRPVFSGPRF